MCIVEYVYMQDHVYVYIFLMEKSFRPGAQKLVAATSSNHEIRLYQYADLTMTGKLEGTNYI